MLQKTMVVVEGVARKLDPRLDMWATAEPVVGAWIADNLGPRGRSRTSAAASRRLAKLVAEAPPRLERLSRLAERDGETPAPAAEPAAGAAMAGDARAGVVGHRGGAALDRLPRAIR